MFAYLPPCLKNIISNQRLELMSVLSDKWCHFSDNRLEPSLLKYKIKFDDITDVQFSGYPFDVYMYLG